MEGAALGLVVLRLGGVAGGDWRGGDEAGENSIEGFHDMRSRVRKAELCAFNFLRFVSERCRGLMRGLMAS